jgi:hypothetical protein
LLKAAVRADADKSQSTGERSTRAELLREVNKEIVRIEHELDDSTQHTAQLMEVLCECGRPNCSSLVLLTHDEYDDVRSDPAHFLLALGHDTTLVERVVRQNERYVVVENEGRAAQLAQEHVLRL